MFVSNEHDADAVHCDDVADFGTPLPIGDRIAPAALRQRGAAGGSGCGARPPAGDQPGAGRADAGKAAHRRRTAGQQPGLPDAGRDYRYRIPHRGCRGSHPGRQCSVRRPHRSPDARRDPGTLYCRVDRALRCRAQCQRDQGVPGQGLCAQSGDRLRRCPRPDYAHRDQRERRGDGGQHPLLCLSRDITERRKSERALRRAHDDLEHKVQERTAQLAQANDVLRSGKGLVPCHAGQHRGCCHHHGCNGTHHLPQHGR